MLSNSYTIQIEIYDKNENESEHGTSTDVKDGTNLELSESTKPIIARKVRIPGVQILDVPPLDAE